MHAARRPGARRAAVDTRLDVIVSSRLAPVPKPPHTIGQRLVYRDDGSRVANRSEVLRRIKAECARGAKGPDRAAGAGREMGLTAVLDEREPVSLGNLRERRHVGRLPVEMHRHDRSRARCDCRSRRRGIERQACRIDIGKHGTCSRHHDSQRRERGRDWGRDDFITRSNAEGPQNEREGIVPVPTPTA